LPSASLRNAPSFAQIQVVVGYERRCLKLPKGVSLHTLRHSDGSHLLAAGMEITAVSVRLGHSSVRVTADVYSHAIRGRDDEAARRWEEFQGQNLPEKHTGVQ
jgi:integrase